MRCFVFVFGLFFATALFADNHARIFVLHSYSQEYPWTRGQHEGFVRKLEAAYDEPLLISTEYLDTKRRPFEPAYAAQTFDYLKDKYAGYSPDLVYVTDDNALVFAREYIDELFPRAPVIFSGVNDLGIGASLDSSRVTGVFEQKRIDRNIDLLENMDRGIDSIVFVGDASNTYQVIEKNIRRTFASRPGIRATFIKSRQIEELKAQLRQRHEQYVFLTTIGGVVSADGQSMELSDTIAQLGMAGDFVILSMEDAYLYDGVLGGYVTSSTGQGSAAAEMALAYLSGIGIPLIPPVTQSPNEYIFDHRQLQMHGLELPDAIADVATILNKPASFYERNRGLILTGLFGLIALVFLLMGLFLLLLSRKNNQVQAKSDELSKQTDMLRKVRNNLVNAQEIAHLGSWEWDIASDTLHWSDEVYRILGERPQSFQPTRKTFLKYIEPGEYDKLEKAISVSARNGQPFDVEIVVTRADGVMRYTRELGSVNFDDSGKPVSVTGTILDTTAIITQERIEKERFKRIERYQDALLEWSTVDFKDIDEALKRATQISAHTLGVERVSIWLYTPDRSAITCESLYVASTGQHEIGQQLTREDFPAYFAALDAGRLMAINDAVNDERTLEFSEDYLKPLHIVSMLDAPIFYQGEVVGVVCHEQLHSMRGWSSYEQEFAAAISKTVSLSLEMEKRRQIEKKLEYQAYHDELTNLPNRSLFVDRLDQAIKQAHRYSHKVAVLFLDLDNFKEINDSLGHATGDQVLVHIAEKLQTTLREGDTIARLGGDEFTLIVNCLEDMQAIETVAIHLVQALQESMTIGDNELYITSSIGISIYPDDGQTSQELLRNADAAMYKAKDEGRNSYQFYTQDMTERAFERVLMETNLRRALENEEFVVYYQPQFDALDGRIIGMEALVRWLHPEMGLISPAQFIPVAEETGLIVPIDRWVMKTALHHVGRWHRLGLQPGKLALNLAVKQLYHDDLIEMIRTSLDEIGFKPGWLALEVTEGQIMTKPEQAIRVLKRISDLGIEIAVDDFGTGYSSLGYLKRLPVSRLKIDQSFVRDIPGDGEDEAIVQAVIALAGSMKLGVLAEGVENDRQKDFLLREGCRHMQGYHFARPMTADDMETLLRKLTAPSGVSEAG